jgi:hypothetical protein
MSLLQWYFRVKNPPSLLHNRFLAWLALAAILVVLPYLVNPV